MQHWGIKNRVLFLALFPTLVISALLGVYFTSIRLEDLQQTLKDKGSAIALRLSPFVERHIFESNVSALQNLAYKTLEDHEIKSIAFYCNQGLEINSTGKLSTPFKIPTQKLQNTEVFIEESEDILTFTVPIRLRDNLTEIYSNPYLSDDQNFKDLIGWLKLELDRKATRIKQYQTFFHSTLIILFGLSLSLILAVKMGRDLVDPILKLVKSVEKIKDGKLNTRVSHATNWELGILESGINTMASALEKAHVELQSNVAQATADLRQTLETIEIQNIELESARKEAESASRVKSQFLANMSHELRTPLNGVIGFIHLLKKTKVTERQQDYLEIIHKSASNLLTIINDVLDFSKIEAGKLRLNNQFIDIRACLEDALTLLIPAAQARGNELVPFVYPEVPKTLCIDPLRLKQILTNLINNAIKFTHKGTIIIRVFIEKIKQETLDIGFSIQDTGIGISISQQKKLFQAFSQAQTNLNISEPGTGLGLVICKKLIEQMGGYITLESTPDEGATFFFSIKTKTEKNIPTPDIQENYFKGLKILLCEPHPVCALALENMLSHWGFEVTKVKNQQMLFESAKNHFYEKNPFQMALVSLQETEFKKAEMAVDIINYQYGSFVGFLVNTIESEIHNKLIHLGANLCISKPVSKNKLFEEFTTLFNSQQKQTVSLGIKKVFEPIEKQVLVVDDNKANLKLLKVMLEELSLVPTLAENGQEAIACCETKQFSLILMDLQMPEINGIEVTKTIRESGGLNAKTPIIVVTAHILPYEKDKLFSAGFNDCLTKPINEDELKSILYRWGQKISPVHKPISTPNKGYLMKKEIIEKEMLEILLKDLPKDWDKIMSLYVLEKYDALKNEVHKLHGASCYCNVPDLKKALSHFETALAKKEYSQLSKHFQAIKSEIELLLENSLDNNTCKKEYV